jgi:hypothetical protein
MGPVEILSLNVVNQHADVIPLGVHIISAEAMTCAQLKVKKTMRQTSEGLDSKLGVRLSEIEEALNKIEANKTLTAITLLVTTRTVGFCAAQIFFQCSV